MICIYCGHKTKVTNSRSSTKSLSTWRRRECLNCHSVFTTREEADLSAALRVQDIDGSLEAFSRDLLLLSIHNALVHSSSRKTPLADSSELTDTIITRFTGLHIKGIIKTGTIAGVTHQTLERFDRLAADLYKAHHSVHFK